MEKQQRVRPESYHKEYLENSKEPVRTVAYKHLLSGLMQSGSMQGEQLATALATLDHQLDRVLQLSDNYHKEIEKENRLSADLMRARWVLGMD